jgi:hypothetical protein
MTKRSIQALLMALIVLVVTAPAALAKKPQVCRSGVIQQALIGAGRLTLQDVDLGVVVDQIRCGDVTNDGDKDALFALASGGTAGDTRFGVLRGNADGTADRLVIYRQGYKIGIARRNKRSFEVIQPHYRANDPNCCPSSFRLRRYTWRGDHFKAGKAKKRKHVPARFLR